MAWWLLLLLLRVLAPEATLLRLHFHQHTEKEPALLHADESARKAVLSSQHQHCHVEEFYNAPFQAVEPTSVEAIVRQRVYAQYRPQALACRASHLLDGASLRGPPSRA
ncbi:hypothetical protein MTX78_12535 [Hymenobacter tibetensis]|uniref:Secreted protein n=1 Tax=Hymenobacter tibetensis TaxID=497967 RepID=A0ABY4CRS8_9BACT|nr:hypothetical protein [Hymenobacter tibetensis]UOG72955.1 hypothetical protein MTX78_12535 [Hymenobacter tibetensis]